MSMEEGFFLDGVALKDRKSTRLNSSHSQISYAVFCLKKKKQPKDPAHHRQPHLADRHFYMPALLRRPRRPLTFHRSSPYPQDLLLTPDRYVPQLGPP